MLLLGISLGFYDLKLAAEYRKGDYTDPYYSYVKLNYRDFDEIELHSATSVNIIVVQGNFNVLAHPQATDYLVVRQEGKRLIIEARYPDHFRGINAAYTLFISCPALSVFKADTKYMIRSVVVTDYALWDPWWLPTVIRGFNLDSLAIREDHASNLVLEGNHIKRLTAVVGAGEAGEIGAAAAGGERGRELSGPVLAIGQGNHFDSSDLNILSKGRLWVKGTDIRQLTYHLADSASLTVNGVSARYLNLH
jgi:hypothetical protein